MKLFANLMCQDIAAQMRFYQALLGLPEAAHSRSPIYCAIETADFQLGFHSPIAYAMLGLANREPRTEAPLPVTTYATFMLDNPEAVDEGCARAQDLGGCVIKRSHATHGGHWQAVLSDPEGHVFQLCTASLPPGVQAPALQLIPFIDVHETAH